MRQEHVLDAELGRGRALRVLVVGAGGSGSAMVMGLPYLDQAMRVWGRGYGLDVTLMDGDVVTATNCVRQPFSVCDIGHNKATVLIHRINLFWGTRWRAIAWHLESDAFADRRFVPDLVVGCVDSKRARARIHALFTRRWMRTRYWLDLGNNASSGQFVLGQPLNEANPRKVDRLRTVSELYPESVDTAAGEDDLPSCSAIEALERQEPYINQALAASSLAMLAQLFRYGRLPYHGAFFNARTGQMSALPIDPERWRRDRRRQQRLATPGMHAGGR